MATLYVISCIAMLTGGSRTRPYDQYTGITIAALTFAELILAVVGIVSARRKSDLIVEVIKISNLAGALTLLVLTQTALMSFSDTNGADPHTTGLTGIVFGSVAGLLGLYMIVRRLPAAGAAAPRAPRLRMRRLRRW